jgi:membrane fusion protein (multidrug efflux system)
VLETTDHKLAQQAAPRRKLPRRKLLIGIMSVLVLAGALWFGIPWIRTTLTTETTDDAFVNSHVTSVAARVGGQVARVLVDDNNRVHKGDVLVALDKEPFEDAVAVKQAAVDTAEANLRSAIAATRGIEAQARSARWNLQHAMEDVDNQVALLEARVAAVDKSKAQLALAQVDFDRAKALVASAATTREIYDQRRAALTVAHAQLTQSLSDVYQLRVSLGLPPQPKAGADLGEVPPDLDQTFSSVLQAEAQLIQHAAELGVVQSYRQTPNQLLEAFRKSAPQGDIDRALDRLAANAPPVKQAEANLEAAKRDLAVAQLNLRYCDVVAEIDGVVTRRNVNPGNNIQVGQSLMAIRSLTDVWVDANFKETQLRDLRIGQAVDLYVDMYGSRKVFKGRISGFTIGTGSTLALLPPENATGNFVKVVQRLPVRIDLEDYDPGKSPLFVGTSVVPYVYLNRPAAGPDAGKFLQSSAPRSPALTRAPNPAGGAK